MLFLSWRRGEIGSLLCVNQAHRFRPASTKERERKRRGKKLIFCFTACLVIRGKLCCNGDDHYFIVIITLLLFLVRAHQHNSNSLFLLFCLFHSICCVKPHSFTSVFPPFFSSSSLRSFLSCSTVLCVGLLSHKLAYFCSLFFYSPLPRVVSHALTCEHLGPTSPLPFFFPVP